MEDLKKTDASPFDQPQDVPGDNALAKVDGDSGPLPLKENPMVTKAPFILANEFCERLAYYGIATNIITYTTKVLNIPNSQSASLINAWSGTCYFTPLIGAFVADAYLGRFRTILIFSTIYLIGMIGLTLSASVPEFKPSPGVPATSAQSAIFWVAMYLVALGTGGIKPCVSTFGADQFQGPRALALLPRFFNFFYAAINVGAIISATVIVNVQDRSWAWGFAIPAIAFVVAIVLFLIGNFTTGYVKLPPAGSPFTRMFRVLVGAVKNRKAVVPADANELYEVEGDESVIVGQEKLPRSESFKWLERAAVPVGAKQADDATEAENPKKSWLVTLTEVEELKCVIRLLPIQLTLIIFNAVYAQMTTMFVLQGEGMDTALGSINVAPATVTVLDSISVIIFVLLYDLVISPAFAKRGKPISLLTRIGAGYFVAILSMIVAAGLEIERLKVVDDNNLQNVDPSAPGAPVVPISVWWQVPQYMLVGLSEVLAMIGSMELFYSEAPAGMRSTCSALQLLSTGLGFYVSAALVAIVQAITKTSTSPGWIADNVNQGHMDYFFFTLAVLMALDLLIFLWIASRYRYHSQSHASFDPEALAMAPVGHTSGLAFSPALTSRLSKDIHEGIVNLQSLQSSAAMSGAASALRQRISTSSSHKATAAAAV